MANNKLRLDLWSGWHTGNSQKKKSQNLIEKALLQILKCDDFHRVFLFLTLQLIKWCPIQTFSHFRIYQASTALQDSRELEGSLVRLEHLVCPAVQRHQTGNNAHGRTTIAN